MTTLTATTQHRDVLTQADAEARAARVSNTTYELALDLKPKAETYRGNITITFDLTGSGSLFLDHRGKTIHRLEVNGRVIDSPDWTGYRLTLPGDALQAKNVVRIDYENDYDPPGDGFHQFIDPEDGAFDVSQFLATHSLHPPTQKSSSLNPRQVTVIFFSSVE